VVAEEPVSTTSRTSVVRAFFPTTTASTMTNSRSTTNERVILVIDHHRRSNQRLGADAGEPHRKTRELRCEITDRFERLVIRRAMANDWGREDLGAAKRRMNDVDETDVLIGIARADVRPRPPLDVGGEFFGSVHTLIFPSSHSVSSFLHRLS